MARTSNSGKGGAEARILASAAGMFANFGYNGVSTRDIATSAGVNEVTIYRHYPRKRDLYVAVLDAELQEVKLRGDLLARIAGPVLEGEQDLVLASRTRGAREPGSMNWHQVLAGHLAGVAIGALYGVRYSDMCAYRAIRRDALERLGMREMTYGWNIEMQMKAARLGLRILEVPMPYRRRSGGASKVAGTLLGSLRAAARIAATFVRVVAAREGGAAATR